MTELLARTKAAKLTPAMCAGWLKGILSCEATLGDNYRLNSDDKAAIAKAVEHLDTLTAIQHKEVFPE